MRSRLTVFSFVAALAVVSAACATKESDDVVGTSGQDVRVLDLTILGTISSGQTKTGCSYVPPNRAAWVFDANAGDVITITVSSQLGDAVAYLTDSNNAVLAYNDDADASTHDARIVYQATATGSYRIAFEDYNHHPASFDVSLDITGGTVCSYAGNTYSAGDTFPSTDGCNTCTCGDDGSVSCGQNACACDPGSDGLNYIGDPDWCKSNGYRCPPGQVRFSNDCGCGCETLTTTHRPKSSP